MICTQRISLAFFATFITLLLASSCNRANVDVEHEIDSLNALAYDVRYTSAQESWNLSNCVIERYGNSGYKDGVYEAYINKAFALRMMLRFDSVKICCDEVLQHSSNDLLRAKADVCMMSVCNQTGQSKEFYDYKNDAQERLKNISKEADVLSKHQVAVWNSVQAQFQLACLSYYARMRQDEGVNEAISWLNDNQEVIANDSTMLALWLVQKSVLGLKDGSSDDAVSEQRRSIIRLLNMSSQKGYKYLMAESMRSLAQSIVRVGQLKPSQQVFVTELTGIEPSDSFGIDLARKSIDLFREYGNKVGESYGLILLSECRLERGDFSGAITGLDMALQLVNKHHKEVNTSHSHKEGMWIDELYTYSENSNTQSTEMMWISDENTICIPELMAHIREQLSIVYGAMGLKAESDYNHNIYFDILDATRLDQKALQEEGNLRHEEIVLNILITLLVLSIIILVVFLYRYSKRSNLKYHQHVDKLSKTIEICQKMTGVLAEECDDEDTLVESLYSLTNDDIRSLFNINNEKWTSAQQSSLIGIDRELFGILLSFHKWVLEKGRLYIRLTDEERKIEADTFAFKKRFNDNKRLYIEKLTSMSIINGITPFLDRAIHEVDVLTSDTSLPADEMKRRLVYISELVDKVNEYNDVLGHWAAIRKGIVSLHIENFTLMPLLQTLKLGTRTFENKGIKLIIQESESVVRADKSLTLFMMNTLLDNARKYTPEGGTVSLSVEETNEYVEVSVSDTGMGMSQEDVDTINNSKVYDSSKIGTQGDDAESVRTKKGFGFGLMNCKGIIEKYRKTNDLFSVCQFKVESTHGKGSRFIFRLPKGVIKTFLVLFAFIALASCGENESVKTNGNDLPVWKMLDTLDVDEHILLAAEYSDSVFDCNVAGDYQRALLFADSAIQQLNANYLKQNPKGALLMALDASSMAELNLWKDKFPTDYNLILSIRNEIAISALALHETRLYRSNNEVFTRLYKLISTDNSLEEYCASIKQANRDRKATVVVLVVFLFVGLIVYFLLEYRHNMLFVLNLRQFIQITNRVFTATDEDAKNVLKQEFDDITIDDNEAKLRELMNTVVDIHNYYSTTKVDERNELLELKEDERKKAEIEDQRVYVQNMIMDNCISALKHETMYYPSRIKQLVECGGNINDINELLKYYKDIFSILSECAGKQVERVLFKRSSISLNEVAEMAAKSFRKYNKDKRGTFSHERALSAKVYGDKLFLTVLIDNVISLWDEHKSGGNLRLSFEETDGFIRFVFTDTQHRFHEEEIPNLFYVDNVKYHPLEDKLTDMQYIIAKQIIREHDEHCGRRGCRIYVENEEEGSGSRFVFTLPRIK